MWDKGTKHHSIEKSPPCMDATCSIQLISLYHCHLSKTTFLIPEEVDGTKAEVVGTMAVVAGTMAVTVIATRAAQVGRRTEVDECAPPHEGLTGSQCWRPTFQIAGPVEC